jgi:hypothetical protein
MAEEGGEARAGRPSRAAILSGAEVSGIAERRSTLARRRDTLLPNRLRFNIAASAATQDAKDCNTNNVLADLGFADPEELTTKSIFTKKLNDVIGSRQLTRSDAAGLLRMSLPEVLRSETTSSGHLARAPDAWANGFGASRRDRRQFFDPKWRRCGSMLPYRRDYSAALDKGRVWSPNPASRPEMEMSSSILSRQSRNQTCDVDTQH